MFAFVIGGLIGFALGAHYAWYNDMPKWVFDAWLVVLQWRKSK